MTDARAAGDRRARAAAATVAWAVLLGAAGSAGAGDGGVTSTTDPDTGLKSWQYEGDGLGIEFVQVPPDYIRGSYATRELPTELIESVATQCVFGSIVRNVSDEPLTYRVADWRYLDADGAEHPVKPKTEWLKEWHGMGVRFSWSILADDVTFSKGDWIQGFTVLNVPHGSPVSLKIVWFTDGKRHEKILPDMECAPAPE